MRQRGAGETRPVALVSGVLRMNVERGRTVEPERVHEIDPALGVGPFGLHHPDVGADEAGDDVADGRRRSGASRKAPERGAAPGRQIAGPPRDHRPDEAVARTEVVVDGGAVLAGGVGDVAYRDAEALAQEELLGHVEQLRLGARRRAPIGLQAPHGCTLPAVRGSVQTLFESPRGLVAMAELRFDGKVAIVTGGGRGLGPGVRPAARGAAGARCW